MGNLFISMGVGAAIIASLFGLWRGAVEQRNALREKVSNIEKQLSETEQLVFAWSDKYDDLRDQYMQARIDAAVAAERESRSNASANSARIQLSQIRDREAQQNVACYAAFARSIDDQRLRNDQLKSIVSAVAGEGGANAAFSSVRLSDSSEPLLRPVRE